MTPAYHLRLGKGADRLLFREMLSHLSGVIRLAEYRYVGMGGPFMEDFRLIHDAFPMMKLSSIESKQQVFLRQKFHRPAKHVQLHYCRVDQYFADIYDTSEKLVAWLDYTNMNFQRLREVWGLVQKLSDGSILRVTVRAEGPDDIDHAVREKWATETFGEYLPEYTDADLDYDRIPNMLLRGMENAANEGTLEVRGRMFQLLNAVHYDDHTRMLTFTGIVGDAELCRRARRALQGWAFKNFNWSPPTRLLLPALSLKERLSLEPYLPSKRGTGKSLSRKLGYLTEDSEDETFKALDGYRLLADSYPRFVRIAF